MSAADFVEDVWYAVSHVTGNSGLYTINKESGDINFIGYTGKTITGLAYEKDQATMYASVWDGSVSKLYTLKLNTAQTTLVGQLSSGIFISIAASNKGILYGINLTDNSLYSINPSTAACTLIGPLGMDINFAQDLAFDRDNGILYGTLYNNFDGGFYVIDTQTGTATLLNTFIAQVAGFAIPYIFQDANSPGEISDLSIVAGEQGALNASLSWINPITSVNGEALEELTTIVVERNGKIVTTISNPVIGGNQEFQDNGITSAGIYKYVIYGTNSSGNGLEVSLSLYIGEDKPAAPSNVVLSASGNYGLITWQAPTTGLNGGYLAGNIAYRVVRMPDNIVVADAVTTTQYLNTSFSGAGRYYYIVTAHNHVGFGGSSISNTVLLAQGQALMYETFDYMAGIVPSGWTRTGVPHSWRVNNNTWAGGQSPELRMNWTPIHTGMSRLVSYPINVEGYEKLRLRFKQRLSNHTVNQGNDTAAVDVSFDGGESWTNLWSYLILEDIIPGEYVLFFNVPENITSMRVGIRFDGNSNNINAWDLDDFIIEPMGGIEGNVTANGTALSGVTVHLQSTNLNKTTNQNGSYDFGNLLPGIYNVKFTKFGYNDVLVEGIIIQPTGISVVNVEMSLLETFSVSGFIAGSDAPEIGIEGAVVQLTGYSNYQATTNAAGQFSIPEVYATKVYGIKVDFDGYETYHGSITVGNSDLIIDDIILTEKAFPVSGVFAKKISTGAMITWNEYDPTTEFSYDDGVVEGELGYQGGYSE
jgi:hypothetical protein